MRILWSSNAAHAATGYSSQTKGVVPAIKAMGHDVAVHAWWGLQGGPVVLDGIQHFPAYLDGYGNDAMPHLCRKWKADVLITLIDLWVMDPALGQMGSTRYCPYFPIDCDPIPAEIAARFPFAHRILLYSQSAVKLVEAYQGGRFKDKVRYLPHGIDGALLQPATPEERVTFRRKYYADWPEDAYIVGMVAANKGYPSRKSFPEAMEAFARFAARHDNARLYLHSYAGPEMKGPPLIDMIRFYGIENKARIANNMMIVGGEYTDEMMREIYATFDVLLAPSQGEGFCLPQVEVQAVGVPVIVTDFSAQTENMGVGWTVPPARLQPTLLWSNMALADVAGVAHALEESYRRPKSPLWGQMAREFALQFDWPKVIPYWAKLLEELDGGRRELALEFVGARD